MSLNCAEIEAVVSELDVVGSHVQQVYQPSYDTIILELYGVGGRRFLLLSVAPNACRIHEIRQLPARNERPLRFMECLKSRIRGATLASIAQIALDRIVRIEFSAPPSNPDAANYTLYVRLWSSAGNMLLVDSDGIIVDALFRKPAKDEVSGKSCHIESDYASIRVVPNAARFTVRDFPGEGNLSDRIAAFYTAQSGDLSRENLLIVARANYEKRLGLLISRKTELEKLRLDYSDAERYRQIGDILMAGSPSTQDQPGPSSSMIEYFDFYQNKPIVVKVDPKLTTIENARHYYEKYKKAASGLSSVIEELKKIEAQKEKLESWYKELIAEQDPFAMAKALQKAGTVRETPRPRYNCIALQDNGWTILIGRSAKENDELLRHEIRGSDLWLHARDYSGSYVFIKAQKNKTFPLELMLDAARLAVYYSKARKNLQGNVYYTFAKYLRRVKDGPKGLVTPSLEKNLYVKFQEDDIRNLLDQTNGGDQ
jgi:predicted ribosome quality control (RQC) complex YloA/Tae2 family protein